MRDGVSRLHRKAGMNGRWSGFLQRLQDGGGREGIQALPHIRGGLTKAAVSIGGFPQWWKLKDGMFWPLDDSFCVCRCGKNTGLCQQQWKSKLWQGRPLEEPCLSHKSIPVPQEKSSNSSQEKSSIKGFRNSHLPIKAAVLLGFLLAFHTGNST